MLFYNDGVVPLQCSLLVVPGSGQLLILVMYLWDTEKRVTQLYVSKTLCSHDFISYFC